MAIVHVDNQAYEMDPKQNLLHGCLRLGMDLPYFCWHPALWVRWAPAANARSNSSKTKLTSTARS